MLLVSFYDVFPEKSSASTPKSERLDEWIQRTQLGPIDEQWAGRPRSKDGEDQQGPRDPEETSAQKDPKDSDP